MHILVTGASGFTGSHIACFLARAGHRVTGLHRRETPFLAALRREPQVTLAPVELAAPSLAEQPFLRAQFDCILHAAATSPAPGVSDAALVGDNVQATQNLLLLARTVGCPRFVLLSSISLYGEIPVPVLDESTPVREPDVYGATKLLCERLLAAQAPHMTGIALRLPGVIGPGAHRNWLSGVARRLLAGEPVPAYNLDGAYNNAVHVEDLARLVAGLAATPARGFDALVLGARGSITLHAAIDRLAEALGRTANIQEIAPVKPAFTIDSRRAMTRWGYEPMEIGAMIARYGAELGATGLS